MARTALSPSRAGDFMQCPLLYRFRVVDRLPEAPSPAAVRGTVVHAVLERLFDLPRGDRSLDAARGLLPSQWERVQAEAPELSALFDGDGEAVAEWLTSAEDLLARWFELEDPNRLEPADRELYVETTLDDGLVLRGYVDRLDVAPDGRIRVVDYKTGRAPRETFEVKALFQMKFYALVLWRLRGRVPSMLQLVYLGSGEILRYAPEEADLLACERKVRALWSAIARAAETGDWRASPGRLCEWCDHRPLCPAWGGTPPPLPQNATELVLGERASALPVPGLDEECGKIGQGTRWGWPPYGSAGGPTALTLPRRQARGSGDALVSCDGAGAVADEEGPCPTRAEEEPWPEVTSQRNRPQRWRRPST